MKILFDTNIYDKIILTNQDDLTIILKKITELVLPGIVQGQLKMIGNSEKLSKIYEFINKIKNKIKDENIINHQLFGFCSYEDDFEMKNTNKKYNDIAGFSSYNDGIDIAGRILTYNDVDYFKSLDNKMVELGAPDKIKIHGDDQIAIIANIEKAILVTEDKDLYNFCINNSFNVLNFNEFLEKTLN